MRITLREAHKLDSKIQAKLREGYKTKHSLPIYQEDDFNDAGWLEIQQEATHEAVKAHLDLISVRYWIRGSIQALNDEVGISAEVTMRANLRDMQVVLKDLIATSDLDDFKVTGTFLAGRREAMATGGVKTYDYGAAGDRFSVNTVGDETYDFARTELKKVNRKLDEIEDTLASLNAGTKITLTDDVVKTLVEADLI